MMRWLVALACVITAAVTAIVLLPASVATAFIPATASRWVSVHSIEGTLWRGGATLSMPNIIPAIAPIQWRCAPRSISFTIACDFSGAIAGRAFVNPVTQSAALENVSTQQTVRATPNSAVSLIAESLDIAIAQGEFASSKTSLNGAALAKRTLWKSGNTTLDLGEVSLDCKPSTVDTAISECTLRNRAAQVSLDGKISLTPAKASGYVEYGEGAAKQRISF
jgi:hypothetical protein